jgi:tail collar domain
MFGLLNQDNMAKPIADEFDRLERALSTFLLAEHYESGAHNMEPAGLGFVMIGSITLWPLAAAPEGWHTCDGAAINRTKFSQLFGLIGTSYGVGDGSTTFTLPTQAGPGSFIYIIFTGLGD